MGPPPVFRSLLACLCAVTALRAQPDAPGPAPAAPEAESAQPSPEAEQDPPPEPTAAAPGPATVDRSRAPAPDSTTEQQQDKGATFDQPQPESEAALPDPGVTVQHPSPVGVSEERTPALRDLDLGATAGLWWHATKGNSGLRYQPAFAWGAHARIEPQRWLGARALVLSLRHPVTVERGALGPTPDTRVEQAAVRSVLLAAQLEPTWCVTPRLRLWGALGTGWSSLVAPAPEALDESIASARRSGVLIEGWASIGVTYELVARWMTGSASLLGGVPLNQSGGVFEPVQALAQDPPAQRIDHYEGLPEFGASVSALLGIGLLL